MVMMVFPISVHVQKIPAEKFDGKIPYGEHKAPLVTLTLVRVEQLMDPRLHSTTPHGRPLAPFVILSLQSTLYPRG